MQVLGIGWLYKGNEVTAITKAGITTKHGETPLEQVSVSDCKKPQSVTT